MEMTDKDPNDAVDFIFKVAPSYAKAKAERIQCQEFRKSLKALIMARHLDKALGAQEREAYSSEEYQMHLKALQIAVEQEALLEWQLEAARMRVDIWRTRSANERLEGRVTI
jgi:hypothetical protein